MKSLTKPIKKLLQFTKYYKDKELFDKTFIFIPDKEGTVLFKGTRYRIKEVK